MTSALDEAAEAAGSDPVARYNAIGKAVIRFSLENPAYYKAWNHPDVAQQADEKLIAAHRAYLEAVKDAAAAAQASGWREGEGLITLLVFSTAVATGAAAMFASTHQSSILDGADLDEIAERVIDLVVPPSAAECRPN